MPWYAVSPRDPADPRWPLPGRRSVTLKAADMDEARRKFASAYPSAPFGSPAIPVPEAGAATFSADALTIAETDEPASPKD